MYTLLTVARVFYEIRQVERNHPVSSGVSLTLEGIKGGGGCQSEPPSIFLALNFCSMADYQNLWRNFSLFIKTSFDPN